MGNYVKAIDSGYVQYDATFIARGIYEEGWWPPRVNASYQRTGCVVEDETAAAIEKAAIIY